MCLNGDMGLKTNFGSFRDVLMKFGSLFNLPDLTNHIKFYEAMTQFSFYVGFHIFHWWKGWLLQKLIFSLYNLVNVSQGDETIEKILLLIENIFVRLDCFSHAKYATLLTFLEK